MGNGLSTLAHGSSSYATRQDLESGIEMETQQRQPTEEDRAHSAAFQRRLNENNGVNGVSGGILRNPTVLVGENRTRLPRNSDNHVEENNAPLTLASNHGLYGIRENNSDLAATSNDGNITVIHNRDHFGIQDNRNQVNVVHNINDLTTDGNSGRLSVGTNRGGTITSSSSKAHAAEHVVMNDGGTINIENSNDRREQGRQRPRQQAGAGREGLYRQAERNRDPDARLGSGHQA